MKTATFIENLADLVVVDGESFGIGEQGYILKIVVKRGTAGGGGLPNGLHVVISIGDEVLHKTPDALAPYHWNESVTKRFDSLEPIVPVIISFTMYKKRWTSPGHKLVGTIQFPLSDLRAILNKGPVEKQFNLMANRRNLTLNGSLILSLELKEDDENASKEQTIVNTVIKRDMSAAGLFGRWIEAVGEGDYGRSLALCLLDDTSALLKTASDYDNKHFGDNIKLLLILILGLFLVLNYHHWISTQVKLSNVAQDLDNLRGSLADFHSYAHK